LIGNESIVFELDRSVADFTEAQLTCKPTKLGLCNDPEHGTEEASRPADASASRGANGPRSRSSETIVARQGIRLITIRLAIVCHSEMPVIGEHWVRHLPSPSRLCAACWKDESEAI
jgi:hypothetical protein